MHVYVGSRTTLERNARGAGISVYRSGADGTLALVQVVGDLVNPSYLVLSRDARTLYTVHGDGTEVSALRVDPTTGELRLLNRQDTRGRNPVHLALSPGGEHLVVTNHLGASVVVLPVRADGSLGAVMQQVPFEGPTGPHRTEQTQAKPHFSPFTPDGRFVIVPDKGLDRVFAFRFEAGRLVPVPGGPAPAREGSGPRNVDFHPTAGLAYVVNELDSTITAYALDAATGALQPRQVVSTLPPDVVGHSRASTIVVDRSARWLYASNRGHDSIARLAIDPTTGLLAWCDAMPSGGRTPRFFSVTPDGAWLHALNEDSDSIVTFAVDRHDGRLTPTGRTVACGSPVCMVYGPGNAR